MTNLWWITPLPQPGLLLSIHTHTHTHTHTLPQVAPLNKHIPVLTVGMITHTTELLAYLGGDVWLTAEGRDPACMWFLCVWDGFVNSRSLIVTVASWYAHSDTSGCFQLMWNVPHISVFSSTDDGFSSGRRMWNSPGGGAQDHEKMLNVT